MVDYVNKMWYNINSFKDCVTYVKIIFGGEIAYE